MSNSFKTVIIRQIGRTFCQTSIGGLLFVSNPDCNHQLKDNMGTLKWITGFLGWAMFGPIGGLLGFFFGSVTESGIEAISRQIGPGQTGEAGQQTYGQTERRTYRKGGYSPTEQRNSFLMSLLVLSSAVIRADGKAAHQELEYVKSFIRQNFGDAAVSDALRILGDLGQKNINIYEVGAQVAMYMNYSQRLQLFHYLAGIANADGDFCKQEKDVLESIAAAIRLNNADSTSVISMYYRDRTSAYSILEVSPTASDEEVKTAYRRMAMKYHPDKVASLGADVQKAAEEKFRRIQEAYETVKKERGIS